VKIAIWELSISTSRRGKGEKKAKENVDVKRIRPNPAMHLPGLGSSERKVGKKKKPRQGREKPSKLGVTWEFEERKIGLTAGRQGKKKKEDLSRSEG